MRGGRGQWRGERGEGERLIKVLIQAWPTVKGTDYCTKAGLLRGVGKFQINKINIP